MVRIEEIPENEFLGVLKSGPLTEQQMYELNTMIDFKVLTASLSKLNPGRKADIDTLLALYELLGKIMIGKISCRQV